MWGRIGSTKLFSLDTQPMTKRKKRQMRNMCKLLIRIGKVAEAQVGKDLKAKQPRALDNREL
jgi:hypothetical protein